MARLVRFALCVVLLVPFAVAAGEDVYRWVDATGEEHYTDDASTIPPKFRKSAKKVEEPPVTRMPSTPARQAPEEPSAGARDREAEAAAEAEAEQRWRSQFGSARRRIVDLEQQIQADSEMLDGGTLAPLHNAAGEMVINPEATAAIRRLSLNEKALVRARQELEDLERRATWDAVPLEWRRGD